MLRFHQLRPTRLRRVTVPWCQILTDPYLYVVVCVSCAWGPVVLTWHRCRQLCSFAQVSSSVAEHLAHSLQDCSNIQEIFQTLYSHGSAISESKIREFEVETERLNR